jgi:hypothetical protein
MGSRTLGGLLVFIGLVVTFAGLIAWGWEDEYGSGTNFFVKTEQDGSVVVYDVRSLLGSALLLVMGGLASRRAERIAQR